MSNTYFDLYCEEVKKNETLEKKFKQSEKERKSLEHRINYLEKTMADTIKKEVESAILQGQEHYEKKIEKLEKKVSSLQAIINQDGTTSGIPTSKTPLNKNKRIPNSREKSNKSLGGQHGHPQHKLQGFSENEVNEHERHGETTCSFCHTLMNPIEKVVFKD